VTASVPIWFDGLAVGQVDVAADGSLSFLYGERWLQTAGAFPLSVTMPLRAELYPSDVISPWLMNLLPEEDVNGKAKVGQRAAQNVATLGLG